MGTVIVLVVVLIMLLILVLIICYNQLVAFRNNVRNAWSQIDVQLQRRFDLIPNLVEAVKGYMKHEEKVLSDVTELRTSWGNAKTLPEKADLDNKLSNTLKTIMAVAENYPELKANQNFTELQLELQNTENKIADARGFYNSQVTMYNTKLDVIPTNIVAKLFNFNREELFKVDDEKSRKNVKISF